MNTTTIGRACATAVISLVGVAAATASAHADDPEPSCDPAVVQASVEHAEDGVTAARTAFVTHTRTSMQVLVRQLKQRETSQAREAAKEARRLTAASRKDASLRDAAKKARDAARVEARQAARVQRASLAALKRQVKLERAALKTSWDDAKDALEQARSHEQECEDAEAPEPTEPSQTPDPGETPGAHA